MILKARNYAIMLLALSIAIVAVEANSSLVSADPCVAQLNYPVMPAVYSYSSVPIVVPVSATCATYYGSQLYATGNAYDTTSNVGLGSVSTALQSFNGGTIFNGQLAFNLPPSTQGHTVQVSVSIYKGQYGNLITATSETIFVGNGNQQVTTTTVTQAYPYPYPTQNPYPYPSPSNQSPYPQPYPPRRQSQNQAQSFNTGALFDYIAIAAILAAVVIATVGLVVYGRRQPNWIPMQPPQHS